jgi:NTP pyrophosphatase (non-canonical NTP hydrolase)
MDMNDYQKQARETATYPREINGLYPVLGLAGEVGEVCEKLADAMFPTVPNMTDCGFILWEAQGLLRKLQKVAAECERFKKRVRSRSGEYTQADYDKAAEAVARVNPAQVEGILKELGDCLWYVGTGADDLGCPLDHVAANNLQKLRSRAARGTLHGSGDSR